MARCVDLAAAPIDVFAAFATRASAKPSGDNFATSAACCASTHACTSRTAIEAGLDQIIRRRGVVADGNDALHTLGDGDGIHTSNNT